MTLERQLEPEVMDTRDEARNYNGMDHSAVNRIFVDDLLAFAAGQGVEELGDVLDLGTGTAQLPIVLCESHADCRVLAIDMSIHMLDLARYNIEAATMIERITLAKVDAKQMGFDDEQFDTVISNSIIHHIPEPMVCLSEMVRVSESGGIIFIRDLMRPTDDASVKQLVQTYAGEENEHSQRMFDDSLRAALSIDEIIAHVVELGFPEASVQATTDRHWTWAAIVQR